VKERERERDGGREREGERERGRERALLGSHVQNGAAAGGHGQVLDTLALFFYHYHYLSLSADTGHRQILFSDIWWAL